jgi:1-acyl-sn-glycerol-3-phosphate acyltransferase
MSNFLPKPLVGIITGFSYGIITIFWATLIFLTSLVQWIPIPKWKKLCHRFMNNCPVYWNDMGNSVINFMCNIEWDIRGVENLQYNDWYLVVCNHQTWPDIVVLQKVFNRKIPPLKFFIKKELLWTLPIITWACWQLDFPFMERYTKKFIEKYPEKKGKDMETTRKSCEKFKNIPTTIVTYLEGSRFTEEKQQRQNSPFKNLLRPRAGGLAFTLGVMGEYLHKILDVTIVYPEKVPTMWDYFCGRVKKIIVHVETLPIPRDMIGDYENDRNFRTHIQMWSNHIWKKKDELIDSLRKP